VSRKIESCSYCQSLISNLHLIQTELICKDSIKGSNRTFQSFINTLDLAENEDSSEYSVKMLNYVWILLVIVNKFLPIITSREIVVEMRRSIYLTSYLDWNHCKFPKYFGSVSNFGIRWYRRRFPRLQQCWFRIEILPWWGGSW